VVCLLDCEIVCLPTWANTKASTVSTRKTLVYSLTFIGGIFCLLGVIGGMVCVPFAQLFSCMNVYMCVCVCKAYPPYYTTSLNMLDKLNLSGSVARFSVYAFPFIQNITAIPVFSILIRTNVSQFGRCNRFGAIFLSVVVPWCFSIFLYQGTYRLAPLLFVSCQSLWYG